MRGSGLRSFECLLALIAMLLSACAHVPPQPSDSSTPPVDVTIYHAKGGIQDPAGTIIKRPGDNVRIRIANTNTHCYAFNQTVTPTTTRNEETPAVAIQRFDEDVFFNARYDGTPLTITIAAFRRDTSSACDPGGERKPGQDPGPWQINVTTDGWDLAFSGAFTGDKLTDPVFSIKPGSEPSPTPGGQSTPGYFVTQEHGRQDKYRLGSAAMVHLYHTDPNALGWRGINWAPVSFGLGVGDSAHVRYYLGTGVRFDKKLFLTVGSVFGPVKALPSSVGADGFTTDANALAATSSRTLRKIFFSVSYSFIGVGADAFKGPFGTATPAPSGSSSNQKAPGGSGEHLAIAIDTTTANATKDYTISVKNDGTSDVDNAALDHQVPGGAKATFAVNGGSTCGVDSSTAVAEIKTPLSLKKGSTCEYAIKLAKSSIAASTPKTAVATVTVKTSSNSFTEDKVSPISIKLHD